MACVVLGSLAIAGSQIVIAQVANGRVVHHASNVSSAPVVIVPGTLVLPDGQPSRMLLARVEAAAALYHEGKVGHVLVSGDNSTVAYNEPVAMRDAAVSLGVPEAAITLDYAGVDTWDTCLRAREQFGVDQAIFVTQEPFSSRAAALCEGAGIDVIVLAIESPDLSGSARLVGTVRETLAKVKATGDLMREPGAKFGGPLIGLVGSEGMPSGGHPPTWDWVSNSPNAGD